jgi:hypothetical protein
MRKSSSFADVNGNLVQRKTPKQNQISKQVTGLQVVDQRVYRPLGQSFVNGAQRPTNPEELHRLAMLQRNAKKSLP